MTFSMLQGCPCTPGTLATGTWTHGDQHVFDRAQGNLKMEGWPRAGWWYMIHGGMALPVSTNGVRAGRHCAAVLCAS